VQVEPFRNPVSEALLGGATAGGAPDALTADDSAERVVAFPDNCCPAGMSSMTIYADGEVYPCDSAIGRSMGSVRQRSVADVWRDDRWSVLRGGWSLDELELCKRCKLADACQIRSCRAYPWAVFDDLYAPAPECVHNAAFLGLQPEDVARYAGGSGAESDD